MIEMRRNKIVTGVTLSVIAGAATLSIGSAGAGAAELPRKSCNSYTFVQTSTNNGAKLHTVVQVCNYKQPCETRYIVVPGIARQMLSTTCLLPPPSRRTR